MVYFQDLCPRAVHEGVPAADGLQVADRVRKEPGGRLQDQQRIKNCSFFILFRFLGKNKYCYFITLLESEKDISFEMPIP